MSLDPVQERFTRLALALPESGEAALAGGGAMLAHGFVDRPTRDLDLFTPQPEDVHRLADAFAAAVRRDGGSAEVVRREPTFVRVIATARDGRAVAVEIAQDARIRETVQLDIGRVLHPDELAADKMLALFGRAAARDLIDVSALMRRYGREELLTLAAEKDPGFDARVFADALDAATGHPDAAFAELGIDAADVQSLRSRAQEWRTDLTTGHSTGGRPNATGQGPPPTGQPRADRSLWRSPSDPRLGSSSEMDPPQQSR